MENMEQPRKPFIVSKKKPLVTYVLIGICVLIFILDFLLRLYFAWKYNADIEILKIFGMKINELIAQGQVWRIVTAIFLHGDITHIVFNMLALYIWGRHIEALYGRGRYITIFFMAGIMSTTASFAFTPANSLGASGAIYGLFGALLYFRKYDKTLFNRIFGVQVLVYLAISLFLGFTMSYVDNVGHIGGIVGGYLAARAVGLLSQVFDKKQSSKICYIAYFAILIGLAAFGMLK